MLSQNAVYDSTWKYITAARAAAIRIGAQNDGEVTFHYSNAVGTAGGALSNWDSNKSMVITQTGQVLVGPTSAQSGGCNLQVSQGITFPATQSASSDANTLDDYEEGTFTPVFTPNSGSFTTASYQVQHGAYQKIGNTVYIQIYMYLNNFSVGTGSGTLYVTGLPFTSINSNGYQSGVVGYTYNWATNSPTKTAIYQNESRVYLFRDNQGATDSSPEIQASNLKTGNPACILGLAISYRVA
jgi:hypothetical protein